MVVAVPQPVVTDLYAELLGLAADDTLRAGQIEWSLRSLVLRNSSDVRARVALIQALVQQGKATEALEETGRAWILHQAADAQVLDTFQIQLIWLGEYERADELFLRLSHLQSRSFRELSIAWNSGDLARLTQLVSDDAPFRRYLKLLDHCGMAEHLPRHQAIVRAALRGHQVATDIVLTPSGDPSSEAPELAHMFYVAADYAARTRLEDEIGNALSSMYQTVGLPVAPFWDLMMPMVMDLSSRPPFRLP